MLWETDPVRIRCLAINRPEAAADWLRASVTQGDEIMILRQLALEGVRPVACLSSHDIVDEVAEKVARRDFCLLVSERLISGLEIQPRAAAPAPAAGVTPSMLRPSSAAAAAPAEAPASEFTDDINQALQAATLEQAARDGVPFCEECEKARQRAAAGRTR
jgi:hypothetical protein